MDNSVLEWINGFYGVFERYSETELRCSGSEITPQFCQGESLRKLFRAGYCWHFACMLKSVFGRGCVCWAAPFSHMVWQDVDGEVYDCEGLYRGEAFYFIPEQFLTEEFIHGFKHLAGESKELTADQLIGAMRGYCAAVGKEYDSRVEDWV